MADILVVDDEGFIRTTLAAVLRRAGHTVRQAADGAAGLAFFREKFPIWLSPTSSCPRPTATP
jgi:CheY-like chemotaxis protein